MKTSQINIYICSTKSVKNKYYSQISGLDLLHDGTHQLFLILGNIQSIVIVESGVTWLVITGINQIVNFGQFTHL